MDKFDESKIKRDQDGKFASLDGGMTKPFDDFGGVRKEQVKTNVTKVDLVADIQKQFDKATPKERQKIAFEYVMNNLRGKYPVAGGRVVAIEKIGADKITHTNNEIKIRVVPELAKLLEKGKFKNIVNAEHKFFKQFAYYDVEFSIGDTIYSGLLNVGIRDNGTSSLYDLNPYNKK